MVQTGSMWSAANCPRRAPACGFMRLEYTDPLTHIDAGGVVGKLVLCPYLAR